MKTNHFMFHHSFIFIFSNKSNSEEHSKKPKVVAGPHSGNAKFDALVIELGMKASKNKVFTRSQAKQLASSKKSEPKKSTPSEESEH